MKRAIALLIPVVALAAGPPAAGDDAKVQKKKCPAEATQCIREMAESLKQRGWIGIEWDDSDPRPVISHVVIGSPAERGGVRIGDVVMAFDGVSTDQKEEVVWAAMKRSLVPGKKITLSVVRQGDPKDLEIELIAVPDHIIAQWVGKHVLENHAAPAQEKVARTP